MQPTLSNSCTTSLAGVRRTDLNSLAAPILLPISERGNLDGRHGEQQALRVKFVPKSTPASLALAKEARRLAIPKKVYGDAIAAFCLECTGVSPAVRGCEADGHCNLYPHSTREKRRKATKTALRRAIAQECRFCTSGHSESCTSPSCQFYRFRYVGKRPERVQR